MYNKFNKGFTLVEIVVVVIVVGVLSGVALPRYFTITERMRANEGEQLLRSLYAAQKQYFLEHNDPLNPYAGNMSDLDIELRPSENFEQVLDSDIFDNPVAADDPIAQIRRKDNKYTLKIDTSANLTCTSASNWCGRIGY